MKKIIFKLAVGISLSIFSSNFALAQTCNAAVQSSAPNSRFLVNDDATVTDLNTGLIWMQCVQGLSGADCASGTAQNLTWDLALQVPQSLNAAGGFGGSSSWRLPNYKELTSLLEIACITPAINANVFPNTPSNNFWSSTPTSQFVDYTFYVNFDTAEGAISQRTGQLFVRLVRDSGL
ncbi:MAG: DUF1566 domain-containing protein [Gammaproteobacteria bacterium]|nr:DUF1566 domain-containing protein [Gammaproteobacteria bacterium]MDH5730227.1 DUF1566 domain-containing protein [Gammaproteobacteria bacterium]